jgi:hypothetical protein
MHRVLCLLNTVEQSTGLSLMARTPTAAVKVDFEWTHGRYECVPSPRDKMRLTLRQIGQWRERVKPLESLSGEGLAVTFANLDGSAGQCLEFANRFGLLTMPAREGAAEFLDGPKQDSWRAQIRKMRSLLSSTEIVRTTTSRAIRLNMTAVDRAMDRPVDTAVDIGLASGLPNTSPTLIMIPRTLLGAMIVQAAQARASGTSFRSCAQCAKLFEQGAGAKRVVARFCSISCRNRHHYERRIGS